jgi:ribosomal-protein-alanine N-acetyltransferase
LTSDTRPNDLLVTVRALSADDVDQVVVLEKEIFPDPWPRSAFEEQLKGPQWGGIVAERDGRVIGYACYLIVANESHLTNIAVDPLHRRKSVAKRLLDRILDIVNERQCEMLLLEVRTSNHAAITFYERFGFEMLYRRPNYYRRPVEDALVMVRHLTP